MLGPERPLPQAFLHPQRAPEEQISASVWAELWMGGCFASSWRCCVGQADYTLSAWEAGTPRLQEKCPCLQHCCKCLVLSGPPHSTGRQRYSQLSNVCSKHQEEKKNRAASANLPPPPALPPHSHFTPILSPFGVSSFPSSPSLPLFFFTFFSSC